MIRLIALCLALIYPAAAQANLGCRLYDDLIKRLGEKYGEKPIFQGINAAGNLSELFIAEDGQSWTFVVSTPDGNACVLDLGAAFNHYPPDFSRPG